MIWTQGLYTLKYQDLVAFQELTLAACRELIVRRGMGGRGGETGIEAGDHLGGYRSLPGGHQWQLANLPLMSLNPWPELVQSPSHGFSRA